MSFDTLTTQEITAAEPVASTMLTKVKNNFDDHEDRIQELEATVTEGLPIIFRVNGYYFAKNGVLKSTANSSLTIIGVRILVDVAGSAGILEIDIQRKRGGGSYESIFSSKPTASYSSGNDYLSAGTLDLTKVDIVSGDILRLDITSSQTNGQGFLVRIDWERG